MNALPGPDPRHLTLDQYEALPDDDRYRDEVVRGLLLREPRPAQLHGRLQLHIGGLLDRFIRRAGAGVVFTDAGYVLQTEPLTLRGPDVSFVATARIPADPYGRGHWRVAPDLAVEILSPADRARELTEKVRDYLDAGVRLVWVVDPAHRVVTVSRPGTPATVLRDPEERLTGEDVVPGFEITLALLFDI